jgi:hypothetical protein
MELFEAVEDAMKGLIRAKESLNCVAPAVHRFFI